MVKTSANNFYACISVTDILALALHLIVDTSAIMHVLSSAVKLICGFERDWERRLCLFGSFVGEVGDESSCQRVITRFFTLETTLNSLLE